MSAWSRFYQPKMTSLYRSNLKRKYQPFLDLIANCNPQYLVEAGCGAGNITRLLHEALPQSTFLCVDRDSQMLTLADRSISETEGRGRTHFERGDITAGRFGYQLRRVSDNARTVIHSHGVLEHFDDKTIRRIVRSCVLSSAVSIHCVPSAKYGSKSFGDERLMSKQRWQELCRPTRIVEFNQGFDLALIWE